jgi:hypothetical protein
MTHIAMQEADDEGTAVMWEGQVSDKEYNSFPPSE